MTLVTRQLYDVCYDSLGRAYRCRSAWYDWGRWVALAVILIGAFLLFFLCSCYSARRRRRIGRQPIYGTGWAGRQWGHGPAQYNPNYQTQQAYQPPPAYNQPANTGYYGQPQGEAAGYFGGGQRDVELQSPQGAYQGGDNVYSPPSGPPPAKH